MINYYKL